MVIKPIDRTIADTIAVSGVERGASLLIAESGRFLVAARPPQATDSRILVNLTGIGGWVEEGETFPEAVQREANEETGSSIEIFDLQETLIVHGPNDMEDVCIVGEVGPAAIVYCRIGGPPFDPWAEQYERIVAVAVYAGSLRDELQVVSMEEHPFFLWLYPEHLVALSDSELPLEYLLADGAEVFGEFSNDPGRVVTRFGDSIPSLLTALGPAAFHFLAEIARLTQPQRAD